MNPSLGTDVSNNPLVDITHWPLVLVRFGTEPLTDAQVEAFIAKVTSILERREKHVFVHDTLRVRTPINARQRHRFMELVNDPRLRDLSRFKIAEILILSSAILRGAMTAVFWIAPPVSPTKTFADAEEAIPFLAQRFREEGLVFGPDMQAALRKWSRG